MLSAITGHFRSIIIFTIIILIHELGHFLAALSLRWNVKKIEIYPYGGCSKFDVDINIPIWEELIVLIMGPITQLIFIYLLQYFIDYNNMIMFDRYSRWILCFNLLPIFPLDGGKFVQLFLCRLTSYYQSCQITLYLSHFFLISLFTCILIYNHNFILILILLVLFITLLKEIKQSSYYYQRFLLERYLNDYHFRRKKNIKDIKKMKRDTTHIISNILEKDYLKQYFG